MTAGEKKWIELILAHGCCVCAKLGKGFHQAEVHHLIVGGKRLGHHHTIPLCPSHHRGTPPIHDEPARHTNHRGFNAEYGGEMTLWKELKKLTEQL
jgi:hypothetical protein